jgi:hypothetical protein
LATDVILYNPANGHSHSLYLSLDIRIEPIQSKNMSKERQANKSHQAKSQFRPGFHELIESGFVDDR